MTSVLVLNNGSEFSGTFSDEATLMRSLKFPNSEMLTIWGGSPTKKVIAAVFSLKSDDPRFDFKSVAGNKTLPLTNLAMAEGKELRSADKVVHEMRLISSNMMKEVQTLGGASASIFLSTAENMMKKVCELEDNRKELTSYRGHVFFEKADQWRRQVFEDMTRFLNTLFIYCKSGRLNLSFISCFPDDVPAPGHDRNSSLLASQDTESVFVPYESSCSQDEDISVYDEDDDEKREMFKDSLSGERINREEYDVDDFDYIPKDSLSGDRTDGDKDQAYGDYSHCVKQEQSSFLQDSSVEVPYSLGNNDFPVQAPDFQADISNRDPEASSLRRNDDFIQEQLFRANEECKRLNEQLKSVNQKVEELQEKLRQADEKSKKQEEQLKLANKEAKQHNKQMEMMEAAKKIGTLQGQIGVLTQEVKTSEEQVERLKKECERLKSRNAYLETLYTH